MAVKLRKVNNTNLEYVENYKYLVPIKENTVLQWQKTLKLTNIRKNRGIPTSLKYKNFDINSHDIWR